MKTSTQIIRTQDFGPASSLRRPLNDALEALSSRTTQLESLAGLVVLPRVTLQTGPSLAPNVAPFPLRIRIEFQPVGLLVLGLENQTLRGDDPASWPTVAVWPHWQANADGSLVVYTVTGLAINTEYRLTLGAIRGV